MLSTLRRARGAPASRIGRPPSRAAHHFVACGDSWIAVRAWVRSSRGTASTTFPPRSRCTTSTPPATRMSRRAVARSAIVCHASKLVTISAWDEGPATDSPLANSGATRSAIPRTIRRDFGGSCPPSTVKLRWSRYPRDRWGRCIHTNLGSCMIQPSIPCCAVRNRTQRAGERRRCRPGAARVPGVRCTGALKEIWGRFPGSVQLQGLNSSSPCGLVTLSP